MRSTWPFPINKPEKSSEASEPHNITRLPVSQDYTTRISEIDTHLSSLKVQIDALSAEYTVSRNERRRSKKTITKDQYEKRYLLLQRQVSCLEQERRDLESILARDALIQFFHQISSETMSTHIKLYGSIRDAIVYGFYQSDIFLSLRTRFLEKRRAYVEDSLDRDFGILCAIFGVEKNIPSLLSALKVKKGKLIAWTQMANKSKLLNIAKGEYRGISFSGQGRVFVPKSNRE